MVDETYNLKNELLYNIVADFANQADSSVKSVQSARIFKSFLKCIIDFLLLLYDVLD